MFKGLADLGISMHYSSSGLDLPIKVVDMFGHGLPVLSISFSCLPELVVDGVNGLVFRNEDELVEHLDKVFAHLGSAELLDRLARNVRQNVKSQTDWDTEWTTLLLPELGLQ